MRRAVIIGVLLAFSLILSGCGKSNSIESKESKTSNIVLDKEAIIQRAIDHINLYPLDYAELCKVTEQDSFYVLNIDLGGRKLEEYVTKDGKYLFTNVIVLKENNDLITKEQVAQEVVDYLRNEVSYDDASLKILEQKFVDEFYEMNMSYDGGERTWYATKDGKYLSPFVANLQEVSIPQNQEYSLKNIQKSDKPKIEVFIMSQGIGDLRKNLIPAWKILKDKADFEIKFLNYVMHGEKEILENLNQYCIQKEQNELYLPYIGCFINSRDSENCIKEKNININLLNSCKQKTDEEFKIVDTMKNIEMDKFPRFPIYDADCLKYNIIGSPTLVVNGYKIKQGSNSKSLLNTICKFFIEPPAECNFEVC